MKVSIGVSGRIDSVGGGMKRAGHGLVGGIVPRDGLERFVRYLITQQTIQQTGPQQGHATVPQQGQSARCRASSGHGVQMQMRRLISLGFDFDSDSL